MEDTAESPERITHPTKVVMSVLLEGGGEMYGFEISELTGIQPGTLYPILNRQTERGRLAERWEEGDARRSGRPLRRYFRLTDEGAAFAKEIAVPLPDPGERADVRHQSAVARLVRHLEGQDPAVLGDALKELCLNRKASS